MIALGGIIGPKAAKLLPYLIGAALVILAFTVGRCTAGSDQRAATATANQKVTERASEAKETASSERATDTATIEAKQKDQIDALQGDSDTVRVRAACQRLRAAGRGEASLPVQCRPQGGS